MVSLLIWKPLVGPGRPFLVFLPEIPKLGKDFAHLICAHVIPFFFFSIFMKVMSLVTPNWISLWSGMAISPLISLPASEVRDDMGPRSMFLG